MSKYLMLLFATLTLLTISCEKEDEYLAGELIAKELKAVIKDNSIDKVVSLNLDQYLSSIDFDSSYGISYEFKGQFIYIEGISYNLNNLIKYRIYSRYGDEIKYLVLTFY